MTKELVKHNPDILSVLKNSFYPGASDSSVAMVLAYCQAADLDVMTKPVHIVPMSVKGPDGNYSMRDVVMPGIELYRVKASRTGTHAGTSEPEFGPTITQEFGANDKKSACTISFPEWCKVTVYRLVSGNLVAFSAKERWTENYATSSRYTDAPNTMWKKRPFAQLAKCAEAQALRRGFPEVGAQPTAEEMEGKEITYDDIVISTKPVVEPPKSLSGKPATSQGVEEPAGQTTEITEPESDAGIPRSTFAEYKAELTMFKGNSEAVLSYWEDIKDNAKRDLDQKKFTMLEAYKECLL